MKTSNPREAYGRTLVELGREYPDLVVLEADLGRSTMTCYFEEAFPDRFFEMGIAEANMTSFAAGLALAGKIPFTNSFAVFAAGRAFDQIRQGIAIAGLRVRIVGSSAGLSDFGDGSTHQSVEDVAIMRAIPNMTVLVPADAIETRKMTRALVETHRGAAYMRIGRDDRPEIFPDAEPFVLGRPLVVRDGSDVVVFANGGMVSRALDAARALEPGGVSVRVVNVSTLKPVDETALRSLAAGMKLAVSAEEHSIVGGLGSVVAEALAGTGPALRTIGIADRFGQSAWTYEELLESYGLTADRIGREIVSAIGDRVTARLD